MKIFLSAFLSVAAVTSMASEGAATMSPPSASGGDIDVGDDTSPVHNLLRRGIIDEKLFHRKLAEKLAEKAAEVEGTTPHNGERQLNASSNSDLNFINCASVACGEVFPSLTRQELIALVDSVVEPALGIANNPDCGGDCCNGLFICYGNVACQSGSSAGFFGCTTGEGVDGSGCCSNYAASGIRAEIREIIKYGVQARKICASCDDYTFPGSTCYNDFCGADVYGHSATHSGLLLVPVDDNGAPIQGILHGSLWYHGTEAATCSIPSEQYSDFVSGSFIANVLSTILFAGFGTVGIAPDGLGYGESYDHFKGYLVKKAYEASAVVLWSEARKVLSGMPGIELGCSAVVSGYSEGGYGAAAAPTGLQCIGVDVKRIQMGAAPFKMSSAQILLGHKNIQEERFPAEQAYYLALLGAPYSTFMPNALVPSPIKLLADNYTYNGIDYVIDDILSLTTEGNSSSQMNDLLPKYNGVQNDTIDPLRIANIAIDNFLDDALTAGDNDPCSSVIAGDPIFPFCETIKENDLSGFVEQLEAGTAGFGSWAVCHSPNTFIGDQTTSDALVFVENIPESIRSNQANQLDLQEVYLGCTECIKDVLPSATYIKTAPLSHQDAGARCVRAFANYLLTTEFSSFDSTSGSTTCQATSASSKSPTNAPTKAPSQSPSKSPITPNPSSSPTKSPSKSPSLSPTDDPSKSPTMSPPATNSPTSGPTSSPTKTPVTNGPTSGPTSSPSKSPTVTYVDKFICAKDDPGDTEVCSTGANVGGECTANGSECSCTKNGRCKTCFVASCSSSSPSPTQAPTPSGGEPPNASCPKCGDGSECCPAVGTCETSGKPTNRNCIPNRLRRA